MASNIDHPEYEPRDCERAGVDRDYVMRNVRSHHWEPFREGQVVYLRHGGSFKLGPPTHRCRRCGYALTSAGVPSPPPPGCDERIASQVLDS